MIQTCQGIGLPLTDWVCVEFLYESRRHGKGGIDDASQQANKQVKERPTGVINAAPISLPERDLLTLYKNRTRTLEESRYSGGRGDVR